MARLHFSTKFGILWQSNCKAGGILGGQAGSRGYVYQALIAVLESLSESNWDRISIEYPTEGDKVDIALLSAQNVVKAIQVKSTENSFTATQLKAWITELLNDCNSPEYQLSIIGHCSNDAVTFSNSIKKYKTGEMDLKANQALKGFDCNILECAKISFQNLPNDQNLLQDLMCVSLFRYMSGLGLNLPYPKIRFIAMNLLAEELLESTHTSYICRADLNERLIAYFRMLAGEYTPDLIPICIQSFSRGAEKSVTSSIAVLNLCDKFNERYLKPEFDWNSDILPQVQSFIEQSTAQDAVYEMRLETHSSIAFMAGHILDTKSGISVFPVQKSYSGRELWRANTFHIINYPRLKVEHIPYMPGCFDTALIINFSHEICKDVEYYIKESSLPIGKIINCSLEGNGGMYFPIQSGTHAMELASAISSALAKRNMNEKQAHLHIFSSAPNAFMFFLGQVSRGFGRCALYEYDFEKKANCSYSPSISIN